MNVHDATEQAFKNGYAAGRSEKVVMDVVIDPGANIPTRAHKDDAGLDLYATTGGWIFPKCRKTFGTGFHIAIPSGVVGLLTAKSGMMQNGLTSRGTIDPGYTGSIKVVLINHSWRFVKIKKGQKISQLLLMPIIKPELNCVERLGDTARGNGGFGSTGKF